MQKEILELHNLIKLKNIDKAYVATKKLYKFHNKNQDIVKILAYLHIQKSNFESTIAVLEEYYKEKPEEKDFDYYVNMGIALKSIEEFEDSLSMYDRSKEINSECIEIHTGKISDLIKANQDNSKEFKKINVLDLRQNDLVITYEK